MAKRANYTDTEDTTELPQAIAEAKQRYINNMGPVRVSDLIREYGGNNREQRGELARELAGIGPGKLPPKGTAERTAYETAGRNIGRWLASESGAAGQKRKPDKASQARLKSIQTQKRPPTHMNISIKGDIRVSDDKRNRKVNIDSNTYPIDVASVLQNIQEGNVSGAYEDIFSSYWNSMSVVKADAIQVTFS